MRWTYRQAFHSRAIQDCARNPAKDLFLLYFDSANLTVVVVVVAVLVVVVVVVVKVVVVVVVVVLLIIPRCHDGWGERDPYPMS